MLGGQAMVQLQYPTPSFEQVVEDRQQWLFLFLFQFLFRVCVPHFHFQAATIDGKILIFWVFCLGAF